MAKPLGYDAQAKTLWQLGVPGVTLEACEIDRPEFLSFLSEAAGAIGTLHRTPVSGTGSVTTVDLISDLRRVSASLIRCRPICSQALLPLVDRLVSQADMIPSQPDATIHGDLHLKNFLVDEAGVTLIDLDNIRTGTPYLDLGSLIAGLYSCSMLHGKSVETVPLLIDPFLRAYETHVPWQIRRDLVDWYTAAALITERAYRCVTRLKEGRPALVEEFIALAEGLSRSSGACTERIQQ